MTNIFGFATGLDFLAIGAGFFGATNFLTTAIFFGGLSFFNGFLRVDFAEDCIGFFDEAFFETAFLGAADFLAILDDFVIEGLRITVFAI